MKDRYKIIISNKNLYKEIEFPIDAQTVRVGTAIECDVRLRKELFFDNFELTFSYGDSWNIVCSDNLYISVGDVRKLITKELEHGNFLSIRYQESNNELFTIEFVIDFEYEKKNYDRVIDISQTVNFIIGGCNNANVYMNDEYVGSDSIVVKKENNIWYVIEKNTKYGVYINGIKQTGKIVIHDNDFISLASFSFCIKKDYLYTDSTKIIGINGLHDLGVRGSSNIFIYPQFNRSTRIKSLIPNEKIDILDPPVAPQKPSGNIIMQLMPAIVMLAVTIVMRGLMSNTGGAYVWFSVISMSLGIITSISSIVTERRKYKKEVKERIEKYQLYIDNKKKYIEECRVIEARILNDIYFSVEQVIDFVEEFSMNLFDRNEFDEDYLAIRVGTGNAEAIKIIDYKLQEKLECNDELAAIPEHIASDFKVIENVPIVVNLKTDGNIGIVGLRNNLYEFSKNIVIDLVTRQYHTDIKLFLITDENNANMFNWIRMLPHIQNEYLGIRNIVCDSDSRNMIFEYLYKELSRREAEDIKAPDIVVLIYNDMGLKSHPISRYIEMGEQVGASFIFFDEYQELLPVGCRKIIYLSNDEKGEIVDSSNKNSIQKFTYNLVTDHSIEKISSKLAPVYCEEVSLEGSLTKNITLFEMLKIMNVEDIDLNRNWSDSKVYNTMAAPLGVKTKNDIVSLDLNEKKHGPHGLVAGTTGSGKSEILQSYILSMATLYHPYDVGFVIIDFKGGGMVNQFKNLPHLIGAITNIDGREIDRSLLSIKAELRKRQELFAKFDVNHIDAYIKLFKKGEAKIPLPHLILIVDEFAELKMDQPEFMKELISASRIGRSLGVHLILATQKPSGVIDAQIWSNSKFKLCLKVQNKEDSNEVIKSPVAAEIKEPGRAYLQVGNNEIFDLFQSAYSGAPASYDESNQQKSFVINALDFSGKKTPVFIKKVDKSGDDKETQLVAITNYVAKYCSESHIERLPGICLPPLDDLIECDKMNKLHDNINTIVPLGIYDDPNNQYQGEATINLLSGNTVIIGSSQFGKTNLLQLIIRNIATNYMPSEVNVYVLDFASMALKVFDGLNHIGGIVSASEDEKLKNLMRMIKNEIKVRKDIFSKMGITSFSSYKEAGNNDIPHIVIMVDNFLALKELYPDYEDEIINICREGVSIGITLVITSIQTNGISYKYMSNFANRVCLYCNQSDEYGNIFEKCRMIPKNVPGRALYSINKVIYEMQTYIAFEGAKEIERVQKIKEFVKSMSESSGLEQAKRIPEVPQVLNSEYIAKQNIKSSKYELITGIDYDFVEFNSIDLTKALTIGITGKKGYGKTNLVKLIINYLQRNVFEIESKVYILDDYEKQLQFLTNYGIVDKYTIDIYDFESLLISIEEELKRRLELVKELGISAIEQEALMIIIIQNKEIFAPDGISKSSIDTYKRILKLYKNMKVAFIFSDIENVPIAYGATEMLKLIKEVNYLYVMDDIANLKLIDINVSVLRQYKKEIELGDAYLVTDKNITKQKIVYEGGSLYG